MNRVLPWKFFLFWIVLASVGVSAKEVDLQTYQSDVLPFFQMHCFECHGKEQPDATFRVDTLAVQITHGDQAQQWREVLDVLNAGEMPPQDVQQPNTREIRRVTDWISNELHRVEQMLQSTGRSVVLRRLNRDEYINTIRDLLAIEKPGWASELPLDGRANGFDTVGTAHSMSATALQKYFIMAGRIVDELFSRPAMKETHPNQVRRFEAEAFVDSGFGGFRTAESRHQLNIKTILGGGVPGGRPFLQAHPEIENAVRTGRSTTPQERTALKKFVVEELSGRRSGHDDRSQGNYSRTPMVYVGPNDVRFIRYWYYNTRPSIKLGLHALPSGTYKVRIHAKGTSFPGAPLSRPVRMRLIENKKTAQPLFVADVKPEEFAIYETTLPIERGTVLLLELMERTGGGPRAARPGDPNLIVDYVELEGPFIDDSGYQRLFAGWDRKPTRENAAELLKRFMSRAWRRPVSDEDIRPVLSTISVRDRSGFDESLKTALRYVLTNPEFLYLIERQPTNDSNRQPLTQYELASRLSYFLWSSLPDDELRQLADTGKLNDRKILASQVERMLKNERSDVFVDRFVSQWLELDKLPPLVPDKNLFPDYDGYLVQCLEAEPKAFFQEILHSDRSVLNFIDSDFAMLNGRLAQHYGIEGVSGNEFRKVILDSNRQRGGLLGQAAVLTLTSNGTRTSPVIRGKWVLENLLADPPTPPPPNVGAIEDVPDIEGQDKLSVRDLLQKHRELASCLHCHRKIDPYGLALENFDAVGAWRTHEMDFDRRTRTLVPVKPIDVADELPRGKTFRDLAEFKSRLLEDQDRFLHCLAGKLMTYATGRTLEFADQQVLEELVDTMRSHNLTLRSLIHGIVQHDVFLTK